MFSRKLNRNIAAPPYRDMKRENHSTQALLYGTRRYWKYRCVPPSPGCRESSFCPFPERTRQIVRLRDYPAEAKAFRKVMYPEAKRSARPRKKGRAEKSEGTPAP
jgi:hypothetical protein